MKKDRIEVHEGVQLGRTPLMDERCRWIERVTGGANRDGVDRLGAEQWRYQLLLDYLGR
jgi:hypothetical protein